MDFDATFFMESVSLTHGTFCTAPIEARTSALGQRLFDLRVYCFAFFIRGVEGLLGLQVDQSFELVVRQTRESHSALGLQNHHPKPARKNEGSDTFVGWGLNPVFLFCQNLNEERQLSV